MNENSSKQVLLSVIGIAVLVVAVVGVSFAFFTYSKEGTTNNVITTGSIFFDFTEGDAIYLTNQFPIDTTTGKNLMVTGENAVLSFSVKGYDSSTKGIDYTIKAIPGTPDASKTRLKDSEVYLYLTTTTTGVTNNYATPSAVGTDGSLTSTGLTLATGKITATSQAAQQSHNYELRMWIPSEIVKIASATDATTHTYSEADFANLYYSLKVKVDARTAS